MMKHDDTITDVTIWGIFLFFLTILWIFSQPSTNLCIFIKFVRLNVRARWKVDWLDLVSFALVQLIGPLYSPVGIIWITHGRPF